MDSDYVADKVQDVVTLGVMSGLGGPGYGLTHPQDALALAISLGSWGNRQSGSYGFVQYEKCEGLCQVGFKALGLDSGEAFTPGFIAFGNGPLRPATVTHENQHGGPQSLITGPAYLPAYGILRIGGYWDHPFEKDARRAQSEGLHFPGFLLP